MLRFSGLGKNNRPLIGLGITADNIALLKNGKPILVRTKQFGLSDIAMDFVIVYGETVEDLKSELSPLIGKKLAA